MSVRTQDDRLRRISGCELEFPNRWNIPTRIFANEEIPLERVAVDELESVLQIQETVDVLRHKAPQFFGSSDDPAVTEVVLTPDFHKGAGIPIGTVLATRDFAVPQAVGNDVNCGMRLITTGFDVDQVTGAGIRLAACVLRGRARHSHDTSSAGGFGAAWFARAILHGTGSAGERDLGFPGSS